MDMDRHRGEGADRDRDRVAEHPDDGSTATPIIRLTFCDFWCVGHTDAHAR